MSLIAFFSTFLYTVCMATYIRARSDVHKEERLIQIKQAADEIFACCAYSDITLTTIAEKLGWSRANLYKYVTTKEEIFLEITSDKMEKYYTALLSAFPEGNKYSIEVIAEVWAGILNAHQEYMRYVSYLNPIIERNVTVERLATFKKKYYDFADVFCVRLGSMLNVPKEEVGKMQTDVLYFASSTAVCCYKNPLILQALEKIGRSAPKWDFYADMKDFLRMRLKWLAGETQ